MRRQIPLGSNVLATSGQLRRAADVLIAFTVLVVVLPLLIVVALAIKAASSGPIFVGKSCVGRGGRRFQMFQFRTGEYDPEGMLPIWACRTTPIGKFLRWTRIDALPQLFNVLRGEMSVVDRDGVWPSFLC